ncbi:alpha/beta hydrolase [Nocardia sp. NEAU-G5]|uniref:Alpha/beta hydrolase n=1 Tax=Nocardia albiluteola TaxID=2842303 RepID=A0ABS6ATM3_9NOCA|nr:alpha/beta hydrolase [Nocardia albiluteola]MBU3060280.1 alpha/beta hydrolase [Nocardia albiluteola]
MPTFQTPTDGTTLAYEDYGTGTPIVFVSGWSLPCDQWERQVPFFLDNGYRCVLLDRRGHGRSDRPSSGYDTDTRADDLAGLIEHLDLRDAILVSHSGGGAEVVRYLTRHGADRVTRIALLAATLPFLRQTEDNPIGIPDELIEATVNDLKTDRARWFSDLSQGYYATHLGTRVSPATIENEIRRCLSTSIVATIEVQRATAYTDSRAELAELTVPMLLLHGVQDQSIPIDLSSRRTVDIAPNAVLKEYIDAGHGLYQSHYAQVNADLLEFIKG